MKPGTGTEFKQGLAIVENDQGPIHHPRAEVRHLFIFCILIIYLFTNVFHLFIYLIIYLFILFYLHVYFIYSFIYYLFT